MATGICPFCEQSAEAPSYHVCFAIRGFFPSHHRGRPGVRRVLEERRRRQQSDGDEAGPWQQIAMKQLEEA